MPERFVCIHGHFYQPPRENPWLEELEPQDSALPYHDWNERVTAECYAPNAAARLLDAQGYIANLSNNYEHISFNFGPTLLAWMERAQPNVYAQIILADQASVRQYGRGNALAQVYGHCIMPLAGRNDQLTQVRWGIADFVYRFGRQPEGMWLPETAVDRATLMALAENGIRFTILAPSQAARVRYGDGAWQEVRDGGIDSTRPYRCVLGAGREITLFFYDAALSHAIAFGGLLNDGREVATRLMAAASRAGGPAPLAHIATDGESYGHHHRFGEMALAAAIDAFAGQSEVRLTNYAAYLDRVAVRDEVEIRENTAWSCAHGIDRWRANCGCNSGGHGEWQQSWRTPLREALDWLKAQVDVLFEDQGAALFKDPWAARDAYIAVILQRDEIRKQAFLAQQVRSGARATLDATQRTRAWQLLEMQRNALLSFTSCGWFFDEPSGLETVQILAYAARAVQLADRLGVRLETELLRRLRKLKSNLPIYRDGADLYAQLVRPQAADGNRIVAHYAMQSLLVKPAAETPVYAYRVTSLDRVDEQAGMARFATGRARLHASLTDEDDEYVYAALHLGGHDIHCAVSSSAAIRDYDRLETRLRTIFTSEPLSKMVLRIDRVFNGAFYTLSDVFVAERRHMFHDLTAQVMAECTAEYERIVNGNSRLLDFLAEAKVPLPQELGVAATFVLQRRAEAGAAAFGAGGASAEAILQVCRDATRWDLTLPLDGVRCVLEAALDGVMRSLSGAAAEAMLLRAHAILDSADALGVKLNIWEAQNQFFVMIRAHGLGGWNAGTLHELRRLGERLGFRLREWETLASEATA